MDSPAPASAARRTVHEHDARRDRVRAHELATVEEVSRHASTCRLCRLCRDRTTVVAGSGASDAEVLVVSEAPGYHEDRLGHLLAGSAGTLFDEVLQAAGLKREGIYLTSVVKCRPPTGRSPFPDEVEACEGWLFREIALVQPRVVVTLGGLALRLVTGRQERLASVHGSVLHAHVQGRDVVVWPLFHPAAALHVPRLAEQLMADARRLRGLLAGARSSPAVAEAAEAPAEAGSSEAGGEDEQLALDIG